MLTLFCTIRTALPSVFAAILVFLALAGSPSAQVVGIDPEKPSVSLDSHLKYWAGLGPVPGPAYQAFQDGAFSEKKETARHGIGHAPEMWLGVKLRNQSSEGTQSEPFVIVYDAPLVVGYRLFLVREDGQIENLVDYSVYQPFNPADHAVNRLRSPEFMLAPNEQVTLLAHLQLGLVPMSLLQVYRPDALAADSLVWASTMTAFYAFVLSCLFIVAGFQIAMKSLVGFLYTSVLFILLMVLANSDMLIFRFVLPELPWVHRASSYANFFLICVAMCMLVAQGLRPKGAPHSYASLFLLGLAGLSVIGLVSTFIIETEFYIHASFAISAIATSVNIFVDRSHWQREDNPNLGFRTLFVMIFLSSGVLMGWSFFGWSTAEFNGRLVFKACYIVLFMSIIVFLTINLIALRLRHMSAVDARVSALEAEAERSRQLLETERAYAQAKETALERQRLLATASHDIKQPLTSLRSTFDTITSDMDETVRTRLADAFRYLETLSKSYVDGTVPDGDPDTFEHSDSKDAEREVFSLSVPLHTIEQMFQQEASSKGINLRVVDTSLETTAAPMALMRILTNLVSNGIKYTDAGGVLIGVRHEDPAIWVCDTGAGMTASEIAAFKNAYHKGQSSTGHGLGLSVCFELAAANDMPLTVASVPGQGTTFRLSLANHVSTPKSK